MILTCDTVASGNSDTAGAVSMPIPSNRLQTRVSARELAAHARCVHPFSWGGGDFIVTSGAPDGQIVVVIGDVMGHDDDAQKLALQLREEVRRALAWISGPGALLAHLNQWVGRHFPEGFVSVGALWLDLDAALAQVASAGHPHLLYLDDSGLIQEIRATGMLLGVADHQEYPEISLNLRPGMRLCGYTDGVIDAVDRAGQAFGKDRLVALLEDASQSPDKTVEHVFQELEAHRALAPIQERDDASLFVVRVDPALAPVLLHDLRARFHKRPT